MTLRYFKYLCVNSADAKRTTSSVVIPIQPSKVAPIEHRLNTTRQQIDTHHSPAYLLSFGLQSSLPYSLLPTEQFPINKQPPSLTPKKTHARLAIQQIQPSLLVELDQRHTHANEPRRRRRRREHIARRRVQYDQRKRIEHEPLQQ